MPMCVPVAWQLDCRAGLRTNLSAAASVVLQAVEASREDSDLPMEGGRTAKEQRCAYLEVLLALAGGLDSNGLFTLFKAASQGMQVGPGLSSFIAALIRTNNYLSTYSLTHSLTPIPTWDCH